jgi:hypothetical protein
VVIHWNTAAIVDDRDAVIVVNGHRDGLTITSQGFVDGVIHHFVNKVV